MNTAGNEMNESIAEASPRVIARIAAVFYLLTIMTSAYALFIFGRLVVSDDAAKTAANILAHEPLYRLAFATDLSATACYIVVTALFYRLFKPVSRTVSLLAAFFSLTGCAVGAVSCLFELAPLLLSRPAPYLSTFKPEQLQALALTSLKMHAQTANIDIVFFGFYCLLTGYLIFNSTFLPRILGALMALAGCGWLTFLWAPIANLVSPYNMAAGGLGEVSLTLWLLIAGVNAQRWKARASAAVERQP